MGALWKWLSQKLAGSWIEVLLRITNDKSRMKAVMAAHQGRHHGLLHMQPVLRLVDGDAAGGVHHRVGGLDVAAQGQAVAEGGRRG